MNKKLMKKISEIKDLDNEIRFEKICLTFYKLLFMKNEVFFSKIKISIYEREKERKFKELNKELIKWKKNLM